jgi:DNA-binding IclR family transcriptional regulator
MEHSPTLRVVRIVDYISSFTDKGVPLSDIVKDLDIPKTTVFNILNTLVNEGVIEETKENVKKYRLGFQSFVIAKRYVEKMTLIDIAKPILKELSDITNLTSFIAKQDKSRIFYVFKYEPILSKRTFANIGSANYINSTSLGKAYLLTLSNIELKKKLEMLEFYQATDKTITKPNVLYQHIIESRIKGYTIDEEESYKGLICFGAPIYNQYGEYEASISISGVFDKIDSKDLYGRLIKQAADKISLQLGYLQRR